MLRLDARPRDGGLESSGQASRTSAHSNGQVVRLSPPGGQLQFGRPASAQQISTAARNSSRAQSNLVSSPRRPAWPLVAQLSLSHSAPFASSKLAGRAASGRREEEKWTSQPDGGKEEEEAAKSGKAKSAREQQLIRQMIGQVGAARTEVCAPRVSGQVANKSRCH